jgi:SAM-dependent methyltransferase
MREDLYRDLYEKEHTHWWHIGKRGIEFALLRRFLPKGKQADRRALDLGCGTGLNIEQMSRYAEVTGTDYVEEALHFCLARGHKRLCKADAALLPFKDGYFDIATALDVIEHLDDDLVALEELYRVMKPGGLLIVSVPAYKFLWTYWDDILGHRRRYTTGMLGKVMEQAGFTVRKLSYSNLLILLPAVLVRMVKSLLLKSARRSGKASDPESDFMTLPGPLNSLLIAYYRLEAWVLQRARLPFGLSVVCVAQRPYETDKDGRGN